MSNIVCVLFNVASNSCLSISIALCYAFAISCTFVAYFTSTYTFVDNYSYASITFSSLTSLCIVYAFTKCCSIDLSSSKFLMNIKSIDVTFDPICSCTPTFFAFAQKLNQRCSSCIYVLNDHIRKLYLFIVHLPFCTFQR